MTERGCGVWLTGSALSCALVGATLTIGAGDLAALPLVKEVPPAIPLLVTEDGASPASPVEHDRAGSERDAPLADLNEALAAARAKLEQLNRAAEALAGAAALRADLAAKEEENRRLSVELEALRKRRAEWQRADDAAKAQIAGLGQALDETAAEAKKLDGELATVRWKNAQLSTSLNRARVEQEAARAETGSVRSELSTRIDDLAAQVQSGAAEIRRLKDELAERGEQLAAADRAQKEIAGRVAGLQQAADAANGELSQVRGRLAATTDRLNQANATLSAAEQERDAALADLDAQRTANGRLGDQLAAVQADLREAKAANEGLEQRLAGLEQAATVATDAARQNLLVVEDQIATLNATLAKVDLPSGATAAAGPDRGPPGARTGDPSGDEREAAETPPAPDEDRAGLDAKGPLAAAPAAGQGAAAGELALLKLVEPSESAPPRSLAELTAELPVESRIQAESLLADLDAETDPEGVKLTVPGGELFAMNGKEVRETAHESLAKVAELINLYKSQPVLIIGYTDAIGAPDYNKTLSERRATLVRQFFIDHFDVDAARLSTQGMGEQKPIASNATAAGRRANRRVEVLILN